MIDLLKTGLQQYRAVAGANTALEKFMRRQYKTASAVVDRRINRRIGNKKHTVFWCDLAHPQRLGLYLKGGCDLKKVWTAVPLIQPHIQGTAGLFKEGIASDSRSDVILQTLKSWPAEQVALSIEKFKLPPHYFEPHLFDPTFTLPGPYGPLTFPKSVIILSIGPDVARNMYQHREHGFLVDPGSWWLEQSMNQVLENLDAVTWFRQNFAARGRIAVQDFYRNYGEIIRLIQTRMDARILVFNSFVLSPGSQLHNYQLARQSEERRRREFNVALWELAQKFDFAVVDIDRIVKNIGVLNAQLDFIHFPKPVHPKIGEEIYRILKEQAVL